MEETIGERVRRLRTAKGWTQVALAYNAGRAPSVVSQVETGKRQPELSTIKHLAEALEVDWRYLLLGDQLPKVPAPSTSGQPSAGEPADDDDELVPLENSLQRMIAAGNDAQQAARDWLREAERGLEEERPLTRIRTLEMYSFHNMLSRIYVDTFQSLLKSARLGIVGYTDEGVNQYLSPDLARWPQEWKTPLYEAGARIAALPRLIRKIELRAAEQRQQDVERALYEEYNVEDHLPAKVVQGSEWRQELDKALAEAGV